MAAGWQMRWYAAGVETGRDQIKTLSLIAGVSCKFTPSTKNDVNPLLSFYVSAVCAKRENY